MPRKILLAAILGTALLALPAQAGKVYQWRDANGKLHLSDKPPPADAGGAPSSTGQPLRTAPEVTVRSMEAPAGSTETHSSPINRQRVDKSIQQYQNVQHID